MWDADSIMKIKVFQFLGSLGDGGAETLVKDYALLLNREIFDVTIITRDKNRETANYKRLQNSGVRITTLCGDASFVDKILRKIFRNRYFAYKFGKYINKEKPDIIHVHLQLLDIISKISKRYLSSVKIIYTCHSIPEVMLGNTSGKEYIAAKKLISRNQLELIALHSKMADQLNEMFGINTTKILYNGIDVNRFSNVSERQEDIRRSIGIPENGFVIGHIGRFTYAKNHAFLISAFEKILSQCADAYLLLVGSGELKDSIQTLVNEKGLQTHVLILSGRTDTERLYKAMNVFAFPSHYEGFPITLIEAQAAGIPCVVSDRLIDDVIVNNNVIAESIEDDEAWVNDIISIANSKSNIDRIYKYDMKDSIIGQLEQIYIDSLN